MSMFDDVSDSDTMLPLFGGIGVILFILIAIFAWHSHKTAMEHGVLAKVESIGTCDDRNCAIKLQIIESGELIQRSTSSKDVFIGDKLMCNKALCYKD